MKWVLIAAATFPIHFLVSMCYFTYFQRALSGNFQTLVIDFISLHVGGEMVQHISTSKYSQHISPDLQNTHQENSPAASLVGDQYCGFFPVCFAYHSCSS